MPALRVRRRRDIRLHAQHVVDLGADGALDDVEIGEIDRAISIDVGDGVEPCLPAPPPVAGAHDVDVGVVDDAVPIQIGIG
jgi:hypothetical protein